MSFHQTTVSGFPAVALRTAELEVVAVPSIGMKLTNLRRPNGREWLWRSDQIPLSPPRPGASYVETADSVVAVLAAHPQLMERPLIVTADRAFIGRPTERVDEFLASRSH